MAAAESRALFYYLWYINQSDPTVAPLLYLDTNKTGTGHGLSKWPYLR